MRVACTILCWVLVVVAVGCGSDDPNAPSDALVLYIDQIEPLGTEEIRLVDAIGFARNTAIAGTPAQGVAAYEDLKGRINDFIQVIGAIPAPTEVAATHQKWVRVWQLRLEHVDLSIQAINLDSDPDLILQSDQKLIESNALREQVDAELNSILPV